MKIIADASKSRGIAAFIDHLMAAGITLLAAALLPESWSAGKAVGVFVVYLSYFVGFEALWSRTPGKYFQGLVVKKLDGTRCDFTGALIRGLARLIEVNPFLLGGLPAAIAILMSERKQRVGDMLAETLVVPVYLVWEGREQLAEGYDDDLVSEGEEQNEES
jgi:uncharacterized RDD family membrane protein YckC